jgi:hypothetical protein
MYEHRNRMDRAQCGRAILVSHFGHRGRTVGVIGIRDEEKLSGINRPTYER